jgi:3-hydroxyisobutyrate dehydrogenase-like beta-hydroxyacid dehydrogenase
VNITIAVLGLGEAGGHFARDLVAAGAVVRGFDPRVTAPDGVVPASGDDDACRGADLVLSVNSAADAVDALRQGLPGCAPGVLWADLNTAAPRRKEELARCAGGAVRVVDVAIMAPVPGLGLSVPMAASGADAEAYAAMMRAFGASVDVLPGPVGVAATRKLLRSVFYKGMAAAILEAMEAATEAGLAEWLEGNIRAELDRAGAATFDRMMRGSRDHAVRRTAEMAAAAELLDDLGVPARVSAAARDWLADLAGRVDDPP